MTAPETRTHTAPELDDAFDLELEQMALAVNEEPLEEEREPGGTWRYVKYQVIDFVKHRGVMLMIMGILGIWIFRYNYEPLLMERAARRGGTLGPESEALLFKTITTFGTLLFAFVGSLVSAAGIVSRDREGGHQKFLFAKPVRITRFYLQALAVNGAGLLATASILLALVSAVFMRSVPVFELLAAVGATFVGVGGLVFLLSTLVRFDLAAGLALAILSVPLREAARRGYWWAQMTSWVLPPIENADALNPSPGSAHIPLLQAVTSMCIYGATYIAIGVAVLRKRSIIR